MKIDPGQQFQVESLSRKKPESKSVEKESAESQNRPSAVVNLSGTAKKLGAIANGLEPYEEVRQDVVNNAKAELDEWNGLSDDQIDDIMDRMFNELN